MEMPKYLMVLRVLHFKQFSQNESTNVSGQKFLKERDFKCDVGSDFISCKM